MAFPSILTIALLSSLNIRITPQLLSFPDHVEKFFQEEAKFGAIHGPFPTPPLDNLHISPCMTYEKPDLDSRRESPRMSFSQCWGF